MQQLASFLSGTWQSGRGRSRLIHHAISGEALWEVTSEGPVSYTHLTLPTSLVV